MVFAPPGRTAKAAEPDLAGLPLSALTRRVPAGSGPAYPWNRDVRPPF